MCIFFDIINLIDFQYQWEILHTNPSDNKNFSFSTEKKKKQSSNVYVNVFCHLIEFSFDSASSSHTCVHSGEAGLTAGRFVKVCVCMCIRLYFSFSKRILCILKIYSHLNVFEVKCGNDYIIY